MNGFLLDKVVDSEVEHTISYKVLDSVFYQVQNVTNTPIYVSTVEIVWNNIFESVRE